MTYKLYVTIAIFLKDSKIMNEFGEMKDSKKFNMARLE